MKSSELLTLIGDIDAALIMSALNRPGDGNNIAVRRRKSQTLLIAAIVIALLSGTALAISRSGIVAFFLKYANPINISENAGEHFQTNLGASENDLVTLRIEEAMYDGQGGVIQLSFSPKDSRHIALRENLMFGEGEEEYIVRRIKDNDGWTTIVMGRKDGKTDIICSADVTVADSGGNEIRVGLENETMRDDGSLVLTYMGVARVPLAGDVRVQVTPHVFVAGEWREDIGDVETAPVEIAPVGAEMTFTGQEYSARLVPVEAVENSRFEILSAQIRCTPVFGYLTIRFAYASSDAEDTGIWFDPVDAEGKQIACAYGRQSPDGYDAKGRAIWVQTVAIQSLDELPEHIWLETTLDEQGVIRIECQVVKD